MRAERIKDDEEYEGVRLHVTALPDHARITVQIDIAFGDRVVPGPEEIDFPHFARLAWSSFEELYA